VTYAEDDLLPLSALQHLLFCERQFALIHVEQIWKENRLTVEGRQLHERADSGAGETRGALRIARGLHLRSLRLGLVGKADVVEFHDVGVPGQPPRPFPVEYKRGRPKEGDEDRVQLCAQALCLEEMLTIDVPAGALYYGTPRRRLEVEFDMGLRTTVERAAERVHALFRDGRTPVVRREPKCDSCSLLERCMPDAVTRRASDYMRRALRHGNGADEEDACDDI
jgi:CRISPR-associated exonuclease Cas4